MIRKESIHTTSWQRLAELNYVEKICNTLYLGCSGITVLPSAHALPDLHTCTKAEAATTCWTSSHKRPTAGLWMGCIPCVMELRRFALP